MTIEFLDSDEPPDVTVDERPEHRRGRGLRIADIVLSLVGAALLVLACFRDIYSIRAGSGTEPIDFAVDGWGRLSDLDGLEIGQHAPRLGIVFCVAAGLAVLGLAGRLSRPGRRRVGSALSCVALGAALAMVGDGVLTGLAAYDSYHRVTLDPGSGDTVGLEPDLGFGGFVWLGLAGAVCVLLAVVLAAVARTRTQRPDAVALPALTDDDEHLA